MANRQEAKNFLYALTDDRQFTFQTFDDNKTKSGALSRIFNGSFDQHADELERLNNLGAGVFVTVNRTDGQGRLIANVTAIRAVFVDLDGEPLEPILQYEHRPHITVESSPGKWHAYWRVKDMPLDRFEGAQKKLIKLFKGDKSVHDLPRVMRMPGFLHRKAEPFETRILSADHTLEPYPASTFVTEGKKRNAKRKGLGELNRLNDVALDNLAKWVPVVFPAAKLRDDGYRISSESLGRDLEEDISITPKGIKDFGVHDLNDSKDGKRTPITLIVEHAKKTLNEAIEWLRELLGMGSGRPIIRVFAGELTETIDKAEDALLKLDDGLYRQGERVVRVIWDKIKVAGGSDGNVLRISEANGSHLVECFTASAIFQRYDLRSEEWVITNCPPNIAEMYLARKGMWRLPYLLGVVTTPTIKPDGSILEEEGYDEGTGILFNSLGVEYPRVADRPTKEEANAALDMLKRPLAEFPFANEESKSVALSGIITAVVRRGLPTAPMHAFSAPTAGSGKSLLVDIASVIATGERASVTSTGGDRSSDAELEKRLASSMLSGDSVLTIDNVEQALSGDFLCQILTQTSAKIRILGKSENAETPITTTFFATGNNLAVVGDLTRRVLIGSLNVDDERPELRTFGFHPIDMVKEFRGAFVHAALTVVRAYFTSNERVRVTPLGSFEDWSRMVREPLIWLGEADPVKTIEDVRKGDPRLQKLRGMMEAWAKTFGDEPQKIRDVMRLANDTDRETNGYSNQDLREAVVSVLGGDKYMNAEKVSWWLRKNAGRVVAGMHFDKMDTGSRMPEWRLVGAGTVVLTGNVPSAGMGIEGAEVENDIPF